MNKKEIITVGIIDDHAIFRKGITLTLRHYATVLNIVFEASNYTELLEHLKKQLVDVILLDINLPETDGLDILKLIQKKYPAVKIIMLSMHEETRYIFYALDHNAAGYLVKTAEPAEIVEAISAAHKEGIYLSNMVKKLILTRKLNATAVNKTTNPLKKLNDKELAILQGICEGKTSKEIGDELTISARTIEKIKERLFLHFDVKNTTSLVYAALKQNII